MTKKKSSILFTFIFLISSILSCYDTIKISCNIKMNKCHNMEAELKQDICCCDLENNLKVNVSEIEQQEVEHKAPVLVTVSWEEYKSNYSKIDPGLSSFFTPLKTIRLII